MSEILDEHETDNTSGITEFTGFSKRVMSTFIEMINVWGVQVITYSYLGLSRGYSELVAITLLWLIKVSMEKMGKPTIGRVATNSMVINLQGKVPTWKQVILRNLVWTLAVAFVWCAQLTTFLYPEWAFDNGGLWAWITSMVSERLLMLLGVALFLLDRTFIAFQSKNQSLQDLLSHTVVIQK